MAPAKIGCLHHGMSPVRGAVAVTPKARLVVAGRIPLLILGHVVLLRRRCSAACSELLPVMLLLLLRSLFVLQSGHTCRLAAAVRRYYLCCMLILRRHSHCSICIMAPAMCTVSRSGFGMRILISHTRAHGDLFPRPAT